MREPFTKVPELLVQSLVLTTRWEETIQTIPCKRIMFVCFTFPDYSSNLPTFEQPGQSKFIPRWSDRGRKVFV